MLISTFPTLTAVLKEVVLPSKTASDTECTLIVTTNADMAVLQMSTQYGTCPVAPVTTNTDITNMAHSPRVVLFAQSWTPHGECVLAHSVEPVSESNAVQYSFMGTLCQCVTYHDLSWQ